MPNINNSYIEISLQGEACELTQAQKQVRWEVWRELLNMDYHEYDAGLGLAMKSDQRGLFQIIKPRPKEEDENWHSWNLENWGCKWDMDILDYNYQGYDFESLTIEGETPWNPPFPILDELVRLGFNVNHQYTSPDCWGNDFFWEGEESADWGGQDPNPVHDITTFPDSLRNFKNWMEENPDEDINEIMFGYIMTGEIGNDVLDFYNFNNKEYFYTQYEHVILHNIEEYYDYLNHEPIQTTEDEEKLKSSRVEIMERIEYLKDKEAIDEGTYLNMCNFLGKIDMTSALAPEKLLVMKASSDLLFNQYYDKTFLMTNYYSGSQEPNLIELY